MKEAIISKLRLSKLPLDISEEDLKRVALFNLKKGLLGDECFAVTLSKKTYLATNFDEDAFQKEFGEDMGQEENKRPKPVEDIPIKVLSIPRWHSPVIIFVLIISIINLTGMAFLYHKSMKGKAKGQKTTLEDTIRPSDSFAKRVEEIKRQK